MMASTMMSMKKDQTEADLGFIRHSILNSLRMYRQKYYNDYGELVICCDDRQSWRRDYFPQYKAGRKSGRDSSPLNWSQIFECFNTIKAELKTIFPYKFIQVEKAEADDIIGVLCREWTGAGPTMIISSDKDFIQLQKFRHTIHQWSPVTKKLVNGNDPNIYLQEHIIKGDKSDGIPNILSTDNSIVEGIRQRPITKKYLQNWSELTMNDEELRNYHRNQKLIDLAETPKEIETEILYQYNQDLEGGRRGLLNFFIEKKLNNLIETIGEF
jgi:5'-3' exonuclease